MWANNVPVPEPPQPALIESDLIESNNINTMTPHNINTMTPVERLTFEFNNFDNCVTIEERVAQLGVILELILTNEYDFLFQRITFRSILREKCETWIQDIYLTEFHDLITTVMARA